VDFDDIELLRGLNFTWCDIAAILGVSRSTVYRKIAEEGLSPALSYTSISDGELDQLIRNIKSTHPNDGERLMTGHLISRGIHIQRSRMRASIHRVDPVNTAIRRMVTIRRRVYYADGPNSVWHVDGHHKLIRWHFVTHGGIDGFSRTVVYLHCSGNNRSETVLSSFMDAVAFYGIPQKVRSDLGGENVEIWRYMIQQYASDSAVIVGSSTHNERIERLWRDVMRCVCSIFYETFKKMEEDGELEPTNLVDIHILHRVYIPRINAALNAFVDSWNNHPISGERNLTPNQLFIKGALIQNSIQTPPTPNTTMNIPSPGDVVSVPNMTFQPCLQLQQELQLINPLAFSTNCGRDILFVSNGNRWSTLILSNHCPNC
jgi:hypothetical protein